MTVTAALRRLVDCLDGQRVPLNSQERAEIPGDYPYWGANGVIDYVGLFLFNDELVLLGEDGAPFDEPMRDVAFRVTGRVWVNNHIHVLRARPGTDSRFLTHALNAVDWMKFVSGSTRFKLTQEDMMRASILVPPLAEQRAIADFLDVETARIDALIAKKRRMIELLASRTESLISSILDPLIKEFGEIPLKAVADLRISNVDKKAYKGEKPIRLCNYTDVYYQRQIHGSLDFMEATATIAQIKRFQLRNGDVLITKDSETAGDIGVPALVTEDLPGIVLGYHLALLRPVRVSGALIYWALRSRRCMDMFSLGASGVTRFGLRKDAIAKVPIPRVNRPVAAAAVGRIERSVDRADRAAAALFAQIDLLLERRGALVTAAVTGGVGV